MIHTFKAVGQPMMLDVGSGAVHAIDETAYDVLSLWNDKKPEEIIEALSEKYSRKELEEVVGELHQLEEIGALNAPDDYSNIELHEPGVVKAIACMRPTTATCAANTASPPRAISAWASASCCPMRWARRRWTGWWKKAASA